MFDVQALVTTIQNGVQAINRLTTVVTSVFPQQNGLATSATAGAQTLPANPVCFIIVTLPNGTTGKIPYYS